MSTVKLLKITEQELQNRRTVESLESLVSRIFDTFNLDSFGQREAVF